MFNPRTNKKRSTPNRGGRGKGMDRQISIEGVYANCRFMQNVGMLVGLPMQVLTKTKETYDGVLTTFGPNFQLVLDLPHAVNTDDPTVISNPESVKKKMIFLAQDIVSIKVPNVELDYATRENFTVDSAISKYNGQVSSEKELEPWYEEDISYADSALEEESANGWNATEMFKKNKEKYGLITTYSPDMEGYTTPLQKKNTQEWKDQEARAHKIAMEIEHSPQTHTRAELENGDEEDRFSAVVRPTSDPPSAGKYMPPQRRKIQGDTIPMNKPPPRVTPPPHQPSVSVGGTGSGRYSNPPPAPTSRYNESNNSSPRTTMPAGSGSAPVSSGPHYGSHQGHMKPHPPHKHTPPHQHSQAGVPPPHIQRMQPIHGDSKINGETKDSRRSNDGPVNYARESSVPKDNYRPSEQPVMHTPQQHYHHPPPTHLHHQNAPPTAQPPPQSHSFNAEQSQQRKSQSQEKEQQIAALKSFGRGFTLADSSDKKVVTSLPSSQQRGSSQNTSIPPPTHMLSQPPPPLSQPSASPSSVPTNIINTAPENQTSAGSNVPQGVCQGVPQVASSPVTEIPVPQVSQAPQPTAPRNVSPPTSKPTEREEGSEKGTGPVSSSKLNPNAKEFVFNPNAKSFIPRSPSTSTPPRVHTPQIAAPVQAQMPAGGGGLSAVGFPQANMVQAYVMAPQQFQVQSQPRFQKRAAVANQRPDYVSSMQVAAATGTPILASTPLTPITAPQSAALHRVPMPQNIMQQTPQPYQCQGMPMMLPFHPSGLPMMTTMVPTSVGGMYYQGVEAHHQQNAPQGHMYVSAQGVPPHQGQAHVANPGPHPGQPPTPQGHGNSSGPPNIPNQPPTPGPTPPQAMIYSGPGSAAAMAAQSGIPQHHPHSHPHPAQSPHNPYQSHNAALAAAAAAAHHPSATQLVVIPPHMTPHMMGHGGSQHSGPGHTPSSGAPYTSTAATAIQHQMNQGHPVQYIQGGAGGQLHQIPMVHQNQ